MKFQLKILILCCAIGGFAFLFSACGEKKVWTPQQKDTWLTACNAKFTKDGVEKKELKRFCDCTLDKIQYDYTYMEVETETIPADKQRDYFNTCSFNW